MHSTHYSDRFTPYRRCSQTIASSKSAELRTSGPWVDCWPENLQHMQGLSQAQKLLKTEKVSLCNSVHYITQDKFLGLSVT